MKYPNKDLLEEEENNKNKTKIDIIKTYIQSESIEEFYINVNLRGVSLKDETVKTLKILYSRVNGTYTLLLPNLIGICPILALSSYIFMILPLGIVGSLFLSCSICLILTILNINIVCAVKVSFDNRKINHLKHFMDNNYKCFQGYEGISTFNDDVYFSKSFSTGFMKFLEV